MRVALGSMFRNAAGYVDRYFDQIAALRAALPALSESVTLRLILAEGDSTDSTYAALLARAMADNVDADIFKREHGGPTFGSVEDAQRWRQISYVMDGVLERIPERTDVFVWVESDLVWDAATLTLLIDHVRQGRDAVAPLSLMRGGGMYDTWGHRKNGQRFSVSPPYHPEVGTELTTLDSAGSCIVTRGDIARQTRCLPVEDGIVGWCTDIRAKGYTLWLDPRVAVVHP